MPSLGSRSKARMSALRAIRFKCLDCMVGQVNEVTKCDILECSLWEFRMGHNPTREDSAKAKSVRVHGRDKELYEPIIRKRVK